MIKTTIYTKEEIDKMIAALQTVYNIPTSDKLPYEPKGLDIYLTGSTAEPVDVKQQIKKTFEPFKETFDKAE